MGLRDIKVPKMKFKKMKIDIVEELINDLYFDIQEELNQALEKEYKKELDVGKTNQFNEILKYMNFYYHYNILSSRNQEEKK